MRYLAAILALALMPVAQANAEPYVCVMVDDRDQVVAVFFPPEGEQWKCNRLEPDGTYDLRLPISLFSQADIDRGNSGAVIALADKIESRVNAWLVGWQR